MLGDRALRLRQPHPLVFLLALDVDPAQLRGEKRCGTGLLDRMGWFLRARALVRVRRAAHTRQGNDAHRPPLRHCTLPFPAGRSRTARAYTTSARLPRCKIRARHDRHRTSTLDPLLRDPRRPDHGGAGARAHGAMAEVRRRLRDAVARCARAVRPRRTAHHRDRLRQRRQPAGARGRASGAGLSGRRGASSGRRPAAARARGAAARERARHLSRRGRGLRAADRPAVRARDPHPVPGSLAEEAPSQAASHPAPVRRPGGEPPHAWRRAAPRHGLAAVRARDAHDTGRHAGPGESRGRRRLRAAAGGTRAHALRAARRAPGPRSLGPGVSANLRLSARLQLAANAWRSPSSTNCTASAPRITPRSRLATLAPVTPITRISGSASSINSSAIASTAAAAASSAPKSAAWPARCSGPNHSRMVASAPGPAMNGNASGKTEISARRRLSAASLLEVRVPDSRANTISSASRNNSKPPNMRNASRLMPMSLRNPAPPSANSSRITADTLTAFSAMRRLYWRVAPAVSPVNSGMSDTGSTTTKNTTKNLSGCSSIDAVAQRAGPR